MLVRGESGGRGKRGQGEGSEDREREARTGRGKRGQGEGSEGREREARAGRGKEALRP